MYVLVAQSCLTLCNPIDCSPPGPSIHGTLQARMLEWVAISFSKRNYRKKESEVAQSCPTPCDPTDCKYNANENETEGITESKRNVYFYLRKTLVKKRGWNFIFKLHFSILDNVWIDSMQ